jgi:hypothetical protein
MLQLSSSSNLHVRKNSQADIFLHTVKVSLSWNIYRIITQYFMTLNCHCAGLMAARSKTWVYGRSPAEIVGSNPTGAWMHVVIVACCQVEVSVTE